VIRIADGVSGTVVHNAKPHDQWTGIRSKVRWDGKKSPFYIMNYLIKPSDEPDAVVTGATELQLTKAKLLARDSQLAELRLRLKIVTQYAVTLCTRAKSAPQMPLTAPPLSV
jgi:hypothetical protein